jgi:hypothetical protein
MPWRRHSDIASAQRSGDEIFMPAPTCVIRRLSSTALTSQTRPRGETVGDPDRADYLLLCDKLSGGDIVEVAFYSMPHPKFDPEANPQVGLPQFIMAPFFIQASQAIVEWEGGACSVELVGTVQETCSSRPP